MIFSRRRGSTGRHARGDESRRAGPRHAARRRGYDEFGPQDPDDAGLDEAREPGRGPYDISEAVTDVPRLDLGSLRIPAIEGVEMRVQADGEVIQQVVMVHGDSTLQLAAFAAPRSEDIWDEVRAEIRELLFNDGVGVQEVDGEYGVELRARVRTPQGLNDLRFVGVSGPRWIVRAVFQGKAAGDPAAAGPLADCLHGLVVDRGVEARPVKEALPLRLPREMADQLTAQAGGAQPTGPAAPAGQAPGPQPGPAAPVGQAPANGATAVPRRKPSPRPRRSG